ncbi:MAG: tetratricopeptide repeat protein [Verrucomicrobia bacterium]|nr:tetratricopeptide repeat protein [Verrucomicrobiota bacterium]
MTKLPHLLWEVFTWLLFLGCVGWLLWQWLRHSAEPGRLIGIWLLSIVLLLVGLAAGIYFNPLWTVLFCVIVAFLWIPSLGDLLISPLTDAFDGGSEEVLPQPFYAVAQARRKRGEYREAIAAIQEQLEKFPADFTGWLLLAEVQADDLKDLAAARATLEQLLSQPGHAPKNLAHALNRLADWQLKLGRDPEAARESLERIGRLFPGTPEAQMAAQRLAHLASSEFLAQQQERPRIVLPRFEDNLGLKAPGAGAQPPTENPAALAEEYVRHLDAFPLDHEIREKLAQLYADHFRRPDLAADQLEQLIAQPSAAPAQVAHWLNRLADVRISGGDEAAARGTLHRIIEQFPQTALAETARRRIAHLGLELRRTQSRQALKLGARDPNPG